MLVVLLDGQPLDAPDAREVWERFSRHMDENQGDLAGFAAAEGLFAVRPEHQQGQAVLLAFTTEEASRAPRPAPRPRPPPPSTPPKAPRNPPPQRKTARPAGKPKGRRP